jgi:hypothetical protein
MQLVAVAAVGRAEIQRCTEMHSEVAFHVPVGLMFVPVDHVMEVQTPVAVEAAVETAEAVLLSLNTFPCAIKDQSQ